MPFLIDVVFALTVLAVADDEAAAPATPPADGPRPTLAETFRPPTLLGLRPERAALSADGRFATYSWTADDGDEPKRDLWLVDTASGLGRVLFTHAEKVSAQWCKTGASLLVERDGWLELLDAEQPEVRRPLMEIPDGTRRLELLDDGRTLVFQAGPEAQVWVLDLVSGERRTPAAALKSRGHWFELEAGADLLAVFARPEGEPDDAPRKLHLLPFSGMGETRVLDLTEGNSVDLSPDGRWVALTSTGPGPGHDLMMADYLTEHVQSVKVRDSLAGDPAPEVTLSLHDVERDRTLTSPLDPANRYYLRRARWSPHVDDAVAGSRLLVDRVSTDFHVRQVLVFDPATGATLPVVSERDEAWIGGPLLWSDWRAGGDELLFTSERSGFNHLYAVPAAGGEARALTAGSFEVSGIEHLWRHDQALLTAHAEEDPAVTRLLHIDLASGDGATLSGLSGCATRPEVSFDGSTVLYRWETLGQPYDLWALRLDAPAPVQLTHSVPAALVQLALPAPEIVEFQNPDDGVTVRAYLYRPEPFDPERTYPAVMFVHGAGYLQQVQRGMSSYEPNMLFHHRLTRMGFAVIDCDFRHSQGYGRDFRADVYGFMGGKDLDDCVAAVDYLGTLGWVDTSRVGLYGGSYGGFLTLMALFTKPDVFACGAALRSVTDWRVYNHWYTNPRLGDPVKDAENYRRSSPIDHVAGLTKPLLLLHGLKDSNVFAQDTIRLVEALIEAGKDFDAMLYPSQGHAFSDPESWIDEYKRIERLFVRELQPEQL